MTERTYTITASELKQYICLAASDVIPVDAPRREADKALEFAQKINKRIAKHLSGEKPFPEEYQEIYRAAEVALQVLKEIFKGVEE